VDPDRWRKLAGCVRRALKIEDLPIADTARFEMEMDPGDFVRGLDGVRALDLRRLSKLPDRFLSRLGVVLLVTYGVPEDVAVVARITTGVDDAAVPD